MNLSINKVTNKKKKQSNVYALYVDKIRKDISKFDLYTDIKTNTVHIYVPMPFRIYMFFNLSQLSLIINY